MADLTILSSPVVKQTDLTSYNTKIKAWVQSQLSTTVTNLGTILRIKGRVEDYSNLPSDPEAKPGDVYMVGTDDSAECKEYLYTESKKWQYIGETNPSLEGYITETQLYKGSSGDGTITDPASDTLLYMIDKTLDTVNTDFNKLKAELAEPISEEDLTAMFTD